MKEVIKEHPLRSIILSFDRSKVVAEYEQRALEAYYRMHDRTWDTQQKILQHHQALREIDIKSSELEYLLLPIAQQLDFLEAAFNINRARDLPLIEGGFSIEMGDFYQDVDHHNEELIALHAQVVVEVRWFNFWNDYIYDNENWFDEDDRKGDALIHEVFRHYDEVSVDIISLDRDQQGFYDTIAEVTSLQEDYFEEGEVVLAEFVRIQQEAEEVYRRAIVVRDAAERYAAGKGE